MVRSSIALERFEVFCATCVGLSHRLLTHFRSLVTASAGARLTAGATRAAWFFAESLELPLLELANLHARTALA